MSDPIGPNQHLTDAIDAICAGQDLDSATASSVLAEVMEGRVNDSQTAGFLVGLRTKGETAAEVAGLARTMRDMSVRVSPKSSPLVDTAGTGGGASTFNVSTTAAIIAAGAGVHLAKHGNRSATSRSGSADVLEALGVPINLDPQRIAESIDSIGFGFMFAPGHHSATRFVVPVRMGLGTRTVFNILGPLTNPAGASRQVVGVGDPTKVAVVAEALAELGTDRALVIHSDDGLDEISIASSSRIVDVRAGGVEELRIGPAELGLATADLKDVAGGSPQENALVTKQIFAGEKGPARDLAVANAAAAILVSGDGNDFAQAARAAEESIDSGAAASVLGQLQEFGQS